MLEYIKFIELKPPGFHSSTLVMINVFLDYELPDVTFNLWYRLSEELYSRLLKLKFFK